MPLIISASGIRGTTEGPVGQNLTPLDAVQWVSAWANWLQARHGQNLAVVVGQDARPSGHILRPVVIHTLRAFGVTVWDAGLTTTPTLALAVPHLSAQGGVMLTASHNPAGWNALKFLDEAGEFLPPATLSEVRALMANLSYPATERPGQVLSADHLLSHHIQTLLAHPFVASVRLPKLRVVVDAINSSGAIYVPALLEAMGVGEVITLHAEPNGLFAHAPEPLPQHLTTLAQQVQELGADLGIAVDPDVDRVAFFLPNGEPFGEEYTLVVAVDYLLSRQRGPVVANLSTTQAVRQVSARHNAAFYESAVGEYHVVQKMKQVGAVIGGEGNGGVIWPAIHYGRDALVGIALFLARLAEAQGDAVALRRTYPTFYQRKHSLPLAQPLAQPEALWEKLIHLAPDATPCLVDGLKLNWEDRWVHVRPSGTEPILRLYVEAPSPEAAQALLDRFAHTLANHLSLA